MAMRHPRRWGPAVGGEQVKIAEKETATVAINQRGGASRAVRPAASGTHGR